MQHPIAIMMQRLLKSTVVLAPWVGALYLLYRLESDAVWRVDMAFRSVYSVGILATGLLLSFWVYSAVRKPRDQDNTRSL